MVLQTKTSVIIILFACVWMVSCNKNKNGISSVRVLAEETPLIHTEDIISLISDSGFTRYRLKTKVWDVFQNDSFSYWYFPQGVDVEQFDAQFNQKGTLHADTAYYYETKALWHIIGNVHIKNADGLILETSELFWDGKPFSPTYAIYTNKFVKITTAEGREAKGIGMHSDIDLKDWVFYQSQGEFDSSESLSTDTTSLESDQEKESEKESQIPSDSITNE